ncbi:Plasmodium exported protein, unknown function [Plasmodium vivax]|uniref:Uncharacterized protein n=1 Tax=Plasmodium vivax TaxID=5855 RepID=A0A565A5Q1_PLAVI|nr:Plasmodium exported protein, unknown function [Plasmodium vivax]
MMWYAINGKFSKSLENIQEQNKSWNIKFNRLLSYSEQQRDLERKRFREKLPDSRTYKGKRNVPDNTSAYSHVKNIGSNHFDIYLKNYKSRYMRKKGLSKLDCYYENKLFKKLSHFDDITENMKYDRKRLKKFLFKKYGITIILFFLIPAIGLIYPIVFGVRNDCPGIVGICSTSGHNVEKYHEKNDGCPYRWLYTNKDLIENIGYINGIFTIILSIIILLVYIYILLKIKKYEKITAGKNKISVK